MLRHPGMTLFKTLVIASALTTACDLATDDSTLPSGQGDDTRPAGPADDPSATAPTLFVYDNGTRCVTAPCPSFTAIAQNGERLSLSTIMFADDIDGAAAMEQLRSGGLLVAGQIDVDSWAPGEPGTELTVVEVLQPAGEYQVRSSGIQCVTDPCPMWSLTALDGTALGEFADIDLAFLGLAPDQETTLRQRLYTSGGVVRGWLAENSWQPGASGDILHVVEVVE